MATSADSARRAPAWGADLPGDEAQARERLLEAAEQCYAKLGPSRTKMTHIAAQAGVHRTTVYSYFPNRDAVLAACYVRAAAMVLDAAEPCWATGKPFLDQLVDACVVGLDVARRSPAMLVLIKDQELPYTRAVVSKSEDWRERLRHGIERRIALAAKEGAVRTDLSPEALAHWVVRICFSLIAEPGRAEDGGDEGVLRAFLPRCVAP